MFDALAQQPHARHQLAQHAVALRVLVARMQRAELDRDTVVALGRGGGIGALGDRGDGAGVALEVAQRVLVGARALAEHVVAEAQGGLLAVRGTGFVHRLGDGLAQHELPAQQLHRAQRGGDHGARTEPGHQAGRMVGLGQEALRHRDRGRRQARQRGIGRALEIGAPELVGRERDGGLGIGHAQQRLGQAHQREALGARDRVFAQQALHGPERRRMVAHRLHPGRGNGRGRGPVERTLEQGESMGDDLGLGSVGVGQAHVFSLVGLAMVHALMANLSPKFDSISG